MIADLGSGTGSMGRWLAPLLTGTQHWVLHDRDAALLAAATLPEAGADGAPVTVETRRGDALDVDLDGVDLVTCSALLDMLTADEIDALAATTVNAGVPALFTLTVTGGARLAPAEPEDPAFAAAFDAHQRRTDGGRTLLGPDAGRAAVEAFTGHGATVHTSASPWRIDTDRAALLEEWLRGWVGAACEHEPGLLADAEPYLRRRLAALADGELRAEVGHLDLLALP